MRGKTRIFPLSEADPSVPQRRPLISCDFHSQIEISGTFARSFVPACLGEQSPELVGAVRLLPQPRLRGVQRLPQLRNLRLAAPLQAGRRARGRKYMYEWPELSSCSIDTWCDGIFLRSHSRWKDSLGEHSPAAARRGGGRRRVQRERQSLLRLLRRAGSSKRSGLGGGARLFCRPCSRRSGTTRDWTVRRAVWLCLWRVRGADFRPTGHSTGVLEGTGHDSRRRRRSRGAEGSAQRNIYIIMKGRPQNAPSERARAASKAPHSARSARRSGTAAQQPAP